MPTDHDSDDASPEGSWSELEQGFFSTAPPDNPVPPPEPMRFDDLDPIAEPRRARSITSERWRARASQAWAATAPARGRVRTATSGTRIALTKAAATTGRTLRSTARTTRTTLRTLSLAAMREGRPRIARLTASLRNLSLRNLSFDRRALTVAIATLLVVTGVSAGVVASRDSGRPELVAAPPPAAPVPAASTPIMSEAPAQPSPPPTAAPALDPSPPPAPRAVRKAPARTRAATPARASVQKKAPPPAAKKSTAAVRASSSGRSR